MRAVVAESADRLVWTEVPDVVPRRGEVLIKVDADGVNRADLQQAAAQYPMPPGVPETLGVEVAGVVADVGEGVTDWVAGQQVCALLAGGGYAEYVAAPTGQVMPIPPGVTVLEAAALPEAACTVWSNLVMTLHLEPGQTLLLHGGTSGIGTHAIQVARALGARVAVTAGSFAKLELAHRLGAQILINYRDEDFVARIREETDGAGADVILDIVGAAYLDRNVDALADDGRLVIIGMQGGINAELNLGKILGKRAGVFGTALRSRPVHGPHGKSTIVRDVVARVWPMISDGWVRPIIGAEFPIEQATAAHRLLSSGDLVGKVILLVGNRSTTPAAAADPPRSESSGAPGR
jgi:putative PIG3 family NAD(P)H quinone oxidoreductase